MKKHLRILYGADDRRELVRDTLSVSYKYFDSVRVVNCGPTRFDVSDISPNIIVEQIPHFHGDIGMCRKHFFYDVDLGDWVLWLDSDERPSQRLLDHLDEVIASCEEKNRDVCRVSFLPHEYTAEWLNGYEDYYLDWDALTPKTREEYPGKRHPPSTDRLVKKSQFTHSVSLFGGHGGIYNLTSEDWGWSPYFILHFKHTLTITQSAVTSVYFNPCINTSWRTACRDVLNLPQMEALRKFQKRTGVITQNDLCVKLHMEKDVAFKMEFKEFCLTEAMQPDADSIAFSYFGKWARHHDLSWETPSFRNHCKKDCCKHENSIL